MDRWYPARKSPQSIYFDQGGEPGSPALGGNGGLQSPPREAVIERSHRAGNAYIFIAASILRASF
jgi:hypothetical protein